MKYKQIANDEKTLDLLGQERLDEINWSSIADKAKSIVKNKQVAGDAKTREGGRKAAKFFMKHWKKSETEATPENLLSWLRGLEKKPDDEVIKYAAQYHKYEEGSEEKTDDEKEADKLSFKPLEPSEKKTLAKLLKRKIKKFPSRWRNFKKLEKELTYLDNDQKLALARVGRIKFKEITGR